MTSVPVEATAFKRPGRFAFLLDTTMIPVWIGVAVLLAFTLAGAFLPLPHNPTAPDANIPLIGPTGDHWFGTDLSGFDVFSRVIRAASRDIPLALIGTLASLAAGVPLGLLASGKGKLGERIMRVTDIFQAFPLLVLSVVLVSLAGRSNQWNVVWAIMITNVPRFMRLVRSEGLALREARFVEAAHSIGATRGRIAFRHILPNVAGVILVQVSLSAAYALVVIAALAFIGIGAPPPEPSWGAMIKSGFSELANGNWWVSIFPGLAIFFCVAWLNVIADALEAKIEKV